jgi:hyperosmotically inducible protein
MNRNLRCIRLTAIALCALLTPPAFTGSTAAAQSGAQADNTAQNKDQSQTADKQSNARDDRMTTAKIRKAIMADKDLSLYAHNIKIITRNGTVTLKGPVQSDDEKQKIETDAASVVSHDSIVDQLTVKQ